jgi:hypothetical protein
MKLADYKSEPTLLERLYAFQYEFGKTLTEDQLTFGKTVHLFLSDWSSTPKSRMEKFESKYPTFKLGEEARDAKNKADSLKPTKKPKKIKKGPKNEQNNNRD